MTLCPSDTLQDWLRKRNSRLSSEASGADAGSGVLFEDDAHAARAPKSPPAAAAVAATAVADPPRGPDDEDANPLPAVLLPEDLESGDLDIGGPGRDDKPVGSPMVSPRTDPVTSASSGADSSSSSSDSGGGARDGALCPPPTRETSRKRERGEGAMQEAFGTTAGEEAAAKTPATAMGSPARSVSSETGFCEGRGSAGTGTGSRVDLHEALRLFRQLAEGVSHIHSKGIIHRDIKVRRRRVCVLCAGLRLEGKRFDVCDCDQPGILSTSWTTRALTKEHIASASLSTPLPLPPPRARAGNTLAQNQTSRRTSSSAKTGASRSGTSGSPGRRPPSRPASQATTTRRPPPTPPSRPRARTPTRLPSFPAGGTTRRGGRPASGTRRGSGRPRTRRRSSCRGGATASGQTCSPSGWSCWSCAAASPPRTSARTPSSRCGSRGERRRPTSPSGAPLWPSWPSSCAAPSPSSAHPRRRCWRGSTPSTGGAGARAAPGASGAAATGGGAGAAAAT